MRLTARERTARHAAASRERKLFASDSAAIKADRIMREYEKAFEACNGRELSLQYASGWVRSPQLTSTYRLADLERMTQVLWARVHEQEIV